MVIDEGFDLSNPALAGRVEAAYTLACHTDDIEDADPLADSASAMDNEAAKAALLSLLAKRDDSCELRAGIADRSNPFTDLESDRRSWNAAVASGRLADAPAIAEQLLLRLLFTPFHGTATASVIAQSNPRVRLILVERAFSKVLGSQKKSESCLTQTAIDQATSLLSDPDVQGAYLARPLAAGDQALSELMANHDVRVVNESFGSVSRSTLEDSVVAQGCEPVSLNAYFTTMAALERAYDEAHARSDVLRSKAAGNAGLPLNGAEDSVECRIGSKERVLIGSYDFDGRRSADSNFGPCVDLYAPGDVIARLPGDWLFPLSGTSFAAPLVARALSASAPRPFHAETARAALMALCDDELRLPARLFPKELLWSPAAASVTSEKLQKDAAPLASGSQFPKSPAALPTAANGTAVQRWLWPARWIQSRQP
jgi:subtilisin family serine protease